MTTPLPAGACGACPSDAGHYCRPCWDALAADGRLRHVLAWRGSRRRPTPGTTPNAPPDVAESPARPALPTRLVCRDHPEQPVTWRARRRLCPQCITDRKAAA